MSLRLETEMKLNIVKWYYENVKSIAKTQRTFKRIYKCKTAPRGQTIRNLVTKFEENGLVANKPAPGPVFTSRTILCSDYTLNIFIVPFHNVDFHFSL